MKPVFQYWPVQGSWRFGLEISLVVAHIWTHIDFCNNIFIYLVVLDQEHLAMKQGARDGLSSIKRAHFPQTVVNERPVRLEKS